MESIIIAHIYHPGSAASNRILAYAKEFSELGMDTILILASEVPFSKPIINNVRIIECYGWHFLLFAKISREIKRIYDSRDSAILVYGTPLLCWYLPKKKYNIFYECTEIPFYGRKKTLSSWLKEIIKVFLARRATGMLVISKALNSYFEAQGIKYISVINMFVDSKRFENVKTDTDGKYIAYCGTISPFKDGVDCLIKAFALFFSTHPNYTLKLIGRFESDDAEKSLKGLVDSLNIANYVEFTGMVKPAEMPQLLCGANMLALARPDNEQAKYGFPTKLGEYLATGKPVVVTNVGEIGHFLKDGVNCKMAKPGDFKDFANMMAWVAENYDEALKLGAKGKELTLTAFSSYEQSRKALDFINRVVCETGN